MPQQTFNSIETGLSLRTKLNANFAELYSLFANNATQTFNFDATTIPSLALWLDAADSNTLFDSVAGGSPVTTNGATIARWKDKSPFNLDATQSVENSKPILMKSLINGKNCIRLDGINDYLTSNLNLNGSTAFTCYMVCKGAGTSPVISFGYRAGAGDGLFITANDFGYGATLYAKSPFGVGSFSASTVMLKGILNGGRYLTVYQNETKSSTLDGYHVNHMPNYFYQGAPTLIGAIGAAVGSIYKYGAGDYCEILVFTSELTPLQRQSVELYLNQKWAIF
jgi:hypothetical protein